MSNYRDIGYHPVTGRLEVADWLDDYYSKRVYGVRFADGLTRHAHKIVRPSPVALYQIAQKMAVAVATSDCPIYGPPGTVSECAKDGEDECRLCQVLARWREFTNKESGNG